MSYYNIYPNMTINYMVCSACGMEAFAWLADVFHCPSCGNHGYIYPDCTGSEPDPGLKEADIQRGLVKGCYEEVRLRFTDECNSGGRPGNDAAMTICEKKRKRSLSDDGGRETH
jgi:hypothetical protein